MSEDDSVLDRAAREPDEVQAYGPLSDQVADIYRPTHEFAAHDSVQLVVFFHGGFWRQRFDRRHVRPLAVALASAGCTVALVEYRRVGAGGTGGWPATFDDARLALQTLAPRLAPCGPMVVGGHSAGGHLALWAAGQPDLTPWARTVALAAVADLQACDDRHLGDDSARALLPGTPATHPEVWRQADPARLPHPAAPVTLIHAADDAIVPLALARSYAATHAGVTVIETEGGHYGLVDPLSPAWPTVRQAFVVP